MKKLLLAAIFLFSLNSHATHQSVLELIYDHIPGTNKYVFTLLENVEYQTQMLVADINSNSPAGTFLIERVSAIPLKEDCIIPNWLNIYRSDTIDLGPIPAGGYIFGYTTCCRSLGLDNIINSASRGYYIEAKMFPEPGQTFASSSPRFVNLATKQWMLVNPFILNQPAIDPDGDSIFYELVAVREGQFGVHTAIPYNTSMNASGTQPLGSSYPLTINQQTGSFSCAVTVPIGFYQFNIQVTSFKNNAVTGVMQRDLRVSAYSGNPTPPAISLINYSGSSTMSINANGVYEVFVRTDDSLSFDINGAVLLDSIFLAGASRLLGITDNTLGNCVALCADFSANPNLFGNANATGRFRFTADTTHLLGSDTTTYEVVFQTVSQAACSPIMSANLFVKITVLRNVGIGIPESQAGQFSVYPNPTQGIFHIENTSTKQLEVRLFSAVGQELQRLNLLPGKNQFNIGAYAKGLYFLVDEAGHSQQIVLH